MDYLPSSYYKPRLSDGRSPPIDWQLYGFFASNCWPLAANITTKRYILDIVVTILQYISVFSGCFGEIQNMYAHKDDVSFVCTILAPFLIAFEMVLRISDILYRRNSFRMHLEEFYKKIYIERHWKPELFEQIRVQQLPTKYSSFTYLISLWTYFYVPINGLFHEQRLLPLPVIYTYDYQATWPRYLLFLAMEIWTGMAVAGPLVAEANILTMQILHLNARYSLLLQDLRGIAKDAIDAEGEDNNSSVVSRFRCGLVDVIRRNVELNNFAQSLQSQYSCRVFIMMALSATLLCVLGFLVATLGFSVDKIRFISWIIGKIVELFIFGRLGTTLATTTNDLSTTYYSCGWEDVVFHSTDAAENAKLMKLMALAIHLNSDPFQLSGLNLFYVNYELVVSILRGAGSYFTVIYAYR